MGESHAGWQRAIGLCVAKLMRDVRKPGLACANALRPAECLFDRGMAWMRLVAQRGKHQVIEPFQKRKARLRNSTHIGEIRGAAEAVTDNLQLAVHHRDATKVYAVDRVVCCQRHKLEPSPVEIGRMRRKGVVEDTFKGLARFIRNVEGNRTALTRRDEAQRAQIVEPQNMVRMREGIKNGSDVVNTAPPNRL